MAVPLTLRPMLASLIDAPLEDPQFVYEPKYDGIRAIAEVAPDRPVRLWSRLGNEKTTQFPEIAAALKQWASRVKTPVVLDGEIVALDAAGHPTGFQQLQGRIHVLTVDAEIAAHHVAFIAFDILREGTTDLRGRPLVERREILERLWSSATAGAQKRSRTSKSSATPSILRISEISRGDGRALYARALASGWEGLIAKRADSRYQSGKRTPDWRKLKIVHEQEFVVGGWTEPRQSRSHFGALLLGVYERGQAVGAQTPLTYVGHTGTGFDQQELARVMARLKPLETDRCPFRQKPPSNERPHWVRPVLVAQVRFTEWTSDGVLRHPVYLGLRDDKKPDEVVREEVPASGFRVQGSEAQPPGRRRTANSEPRTGNPEPRTRNLLSSLRAIEDARKDDELVLPEGRLRVGNLHKVFWPKEKFTKGDLFRYYVEVAPYILPAVADRPLVMKRFPNGVDGQPFYQHRAYDVPDNVRIETPDVPDGIPQIIGGRLMELLYTTQLAAISQDPWLSRIQSAQFADHVAIDIDPPEGVSFESVLDVARWVHDELETLGAVGFPKTSGADGLHVYIPLPPNTPYEAGMLFCQIIATVVAQKHPKIATVERQVRARGSRIYVDYLQNILGKTLATAYSARASSYAGVSTPLTWKEVHKGVRREDFTIKTIPARLKEVGDLWAALRTSKGVDLSRALSYTGEETTASHQRTVRKRSPGRSR